MQGSGEYPKGELRAMLSAQCQYRCVGGGSQQIVVFNVTYMQPAQGGSNGCLCA